MTKQFNFIIGNKLITIYDKNQQTAEQKAHELYKELQNNDN